MSRVVTSVMPSCMACRAFVVVWMPSFKACRAAFVVAMPSLQACRAVVSVLPSFIAYRCTLGFKSTNHRVAPLCISCSRSLRTLLSILMLSRRNVMVSFIARYICDPPLLIFTTHSSSHLRKRIGRLLSDIELRESWCTIALMTHVQADQPLALAVSTC